MKGRNQIEWREKMFQAGIQSDFTGTMRIWQELPDGYRKQSIAEAMLRAVPEARKAEAKAVLQP